MNIPLFIVIFKRINKYLFIFYFHIMLFLVNIEIVETTKEGSPQRINKIIIEKR